MYDPKSELLRMPPEVVAERVVEILPGGGVVVFTGGEPMLQQEKVLHVAEILSVMAAPGTLQFAVETAGTIAPTIRFPFLQEQWTVSPKLVNSGNGPARYRPKAIRAFVERGADFKFVLTSRDDLPEIESIVAVNDIEPQHVWLMPEGTDATKLIERAQWVSQAALVRGWQFTQRLHVLLWGDKRGH